MADKVHCIRKTLRLMPQEAKVLSDKAKANGMNEAEYIRLLISQKPNDYPEVRKLLKELIIYEKAESICQRGGGKDWQSVRYFT